MRERERDGGKEGEMRREVGGGGGEGCRELLGVARERSVTSGSFSEVCKMRRHKASQLTTCLVL